jgi:hypothetical protein
MAELVPSAQWGAVAGLSPEAQALCNLLAEIMHL